MKTNDLKDIWKSGVNKNINSYSDRKLNEIIVKSARKSISRIYPSVILMIIIAIVIALLIANITIRNTTIAMRMLDLGVLLFLVISLTLWAQSFLVMKKYKADVPIKNWLEYRIKEIERSLNFNIKYNWLICIISLLAALGYYYLFIWFSGISINPWIIGFVTAGVVVFIFTSRKSVIKKYRQSLEELKELYKQLDEE
ncbi:hypothetical protein JGH11_09895 [Dysgonomonas sp. Marseille-P4677]|uniref:hypothetical protein n=1 Tax=Dysgonomonas sp. Marseille-P4677 TaxID=2364790 RepID=UPI0019122D04|nr:hypothetical protein [Dysgonomonas sp. Marseille-P4677]MBK5721180.1 hypothetical protein [Dysgonomonas sp. Marseille-P4677]